jgi:hypothetical protein
MAATEPVADVGASRSSGLMRTILVTLVLLSGCNSQPERDADEKTANSRSVPQLLMDQIEEEVQLPPEAYPLAEYARYYAFENGRVYATYTTHVDPANGDANLRTGERRWLTDRRKLPVLLDGGCSVVNVVYDSQEASVEQAFCNGVA